MRYLLPLLLFLTAVSCSAEEQLKLGDLYKMCTSSTPSDKAACHYYVVGVFDGASFASAVVQEASGKYVERKDKPYCVPDELDGLAKELIVRMRMGEDLAVFPQDGEMPAVSFLTAVIAKQFPCHKAK